MERSQRGWILLESVIAIFAVYGILGIPLFNADTMKVFFIGFGAFYGVALLGMYSTYLSYKKSSIILGKNKKEPEKRGFRSSILEPQVLLLFAVMIVGGAMREYKVSAFYQNIVLLSSALIIGPFHFFWCRRGIPKEDENDHGRREEFTHISIMAGICLVGILGMSLRLYLL